MNRLTLIFLLVMMNLLVSNQLNAQRNPKFFYGTVTDDATRRPVTGANLKVEGSKVGTTTDKKGAFSFFIDSIPATLTISYIGYKTKSVILDETSYSLSLYISRTPIELEEVEIAAKAIEPFFQSERFTVLDYDIDSNQVWLLIYRQRISNAQLICKDIYGDTLATSAPFSFKPTRLFRDCIGTLHVLGRDSGFQVFMNEGMITFIHPVKMKKFDMVLKNCVAASEEFLFFRRETENGLSVEFFGIDRKTLNRQNLSVVGDEEKLKMKRRNRDDALLLGRDKPPDSREDFVTWNYVHKILYRPVSASLFILGGFTWIFNTPEMQAECYDAGGNFSGKIKLKTDQPGLGRWTKDVLTDLTDGKVFTTYIRNGRYSLYEIDLNTGALKHRVDLEHLFPEKIKVYNGWVYYLYDVDSSADNKVLYRQKF